MGLVCDKLAAPPGAVDDRPSSPRWARRILVALVAIAASLGGTAPAFGAEPIDWTVSSTIIGRDGEDLPLRIGQHDSPGSEGFGILHIQDGHGGFVPDPGLVQQAAEACASNPDPNALTVCRIPGDGGRSFRVVWTERIDPRAPDGRPVGIITAFYE